MQIHAEIFIFPVFSAKLFNRKIFDGISSSGKTQHFDCCIRRFESCYPSLTSAPQPMFLFAAQISKTHNKDMLFRERTHKKLLVRLPVMIYSLNGQSVIQQYCNRKKLIVLRRYRYFALCPFENCNSGIFSRSFMARLESGRLICKSPDALLIDFTPHISNKYAYFIKKTSHNGCFEHIRGSAIVSSIFIITYFITANNEAGIKIMLYDISFFVEICYNVHSIKKTNLPHKIIFSQSVRLFNNL